jgi:hypothetical protein
MCSTICCNAVSLPGRISTNKCGLDKHMQRTFLQFLSAKNSDSYCHIPQKYGPIHRFVRVPHWAFSALTLQNERDIQISTQGAQTERC